MRQGFQRFTLAVWVAAALAGCASRPTVEGDEATLPQPFEIELRAWSKDQRRVHYRLKPDGELEFVAGRNASLRETEPLGVVTPDQRRHLWQIVRAHNLLDARGQLLADGDNTTYELSLLAGSRRNRLKTSDARVPGVAELDQALLKLASDIRYERAFKPIESAIEQSGGAVKKTYGR